VKVALCINVLCCVVRWAKEPSTLPLGTITSVSYNISVMLVQMSTYKTRSAEPAFYYTVSLKPFFCNFFFTLFFSIAVQLMEILSSITVSLPY